MMIRVEKILLGFVLVTSPLRWRIVLAARPRGTIYADYTDFLLFLPDVFLLVLLLIWGLRNLQQGQLIFRPQSMFWLLASLVFIGLLTSVTAIDPALALYHSVRLLGLLGFFSYIVQQRIHPADLGPASAVLLTTQGLTALGQFARQRDLGWQRWGEYELDPAWNGVSVVTANGERWLRAYGLSDHPNILGGLLAFALLLLAAWWVAAPARWRIVSSPAVFIGALGLAVTFSRSAWLALGLGLLFWLVTLVRRGERRLAQQLTLFAVTCAMAFGGVVAHSPALFVTRLGGQAAFREVAGEEQSLGERALLNSMANQMFNARPLTGVGLGVSPQALATTYPEFPTYYQPPHNVLLAAGVETGLFGAAGVFLLLIVPWLGLSARHSAGLGAYGLLLAISMVGMLDYYPWLLVPGRLWQYLAWGLVSVQMVSGARDE